MRVLLSPDLTKKIATADDFQQKKVAAFCELIDGLSSLEFRKKPKQTEKFAGLDISIQLDDHATCPLYSYRLNNKARLYYVIVKTHLLYVLDIDWDHQHGRFSLLQDASTRNAFIPLIQAAYAHLTAETVVPVAASSLMQRDRLLTLKGDQRVVLENDGKAKIILASAGTGKTCSLLAWAEQLIKETDQSLRYFVPTLALRRAIEANFTFASAEKQKIAFCSEKTIARLFLKKLFPDMGRRLQLRRPADKAFFMQWYEEKTNSIKKAHAKVVLDDGHLLYAEITQVIIQPKPPYSDAFLAKDVYLQLGDDQSYFSKSERESIYALFKEYLEYIEHQQHYEPHLLWHECYVRLQTAAVLSNTVDALIIDEVQAVHPWLMRCLLEMTTGRQAGLVRIAGDPLQTGREPRRYVLASITQALETQSIPFTLVQLAYNWRNARLIGLFSNQLLHLKAKHCGTRERRANIGVDSSQSELLGEVRVDMPTAEELVNIKKDVNCVIIVPDDADMVQAQEKWGNHVFTVSTVGGLEWKHVFFYVPTESRFFSSALLSRLSPVDIPAITNETADNSPRHARKAIPDLSAEIILSQWYLAASRAQQTLRILIDSGTPAWIATLVEQVQIYALAQGTEYQHAHFAIEASTPAQWLERIRFYLREGQSEEVVQRTLFGHAVWGDEDAALLAKKVVIQLTSVLVEQIEWVDLFIAYPQTTAILKAADYMLNAAFAESFEDFLSRLRRGLQEKKAVKDIFPHADPLRLAPVRSEAAVSSLQTTEKRKGRTQGFFGLSSVENTGSSFEEAKHAHQRIIDMLSAEEPKELAGLVSLLRNICSAVNDYDKNDLFATTDWNNHRRALHYDSVLHAIVRYLISYRSVKNDEQVLPKASTSQITSYYGSDVHLSGLKMILETIDRMAKNYPEEVCADLEFEGKDIIVKALGALAVAVITRRLVFPIRSIFFNFLLKNDGITIDNFKEGSIVAFHHKQALVACELLIAVIDRLYKKHHAEPKYADKKLPLRDFENARQETRCRLERGDMGLDSSVDIKLTAKFIKALLWPHLFNRMLELNTFIGWALAIYLLDKLILEYVKPLFMQSDLPSEGARFRRM